MQILTAADMTAADQRAIAAGIPLQTLMHNAGTAVAHFCLQHYPGEGLVVVFCGKGNNGGDGIVAAHAIATTGRPVRIALLGTLTDLNAEARQALDSQTRNSKLNRPALYEITDTTTLTTALADATLILDAIVGTGFKPPLRGLAATARDLLANTTIPIVAIDLPSGWDADATTQTSPGALRADAVITFAAPKLAHIFGQLTTATFGPVVVAPIGIPAEAVVSTTNLHWAGSAKAITEKPRGIDGNKGKFGHVLIVGGAFGKAGAPAMASLAAMRAGAGLVTAAVPHEILPTVAATAPELMLTPLPSSPLKSGWPIHAQPPTSGWPIHGQHLGHEWETTDLDLATLEEPALSALLQGITVVGIGPGLGQQGTTPEWVRTFLERVTLPTVIDADALNAIAERPDFLSAIAKDRTLVLTPHPGEMARLLGLTVKQVEADRTGLARRFATTHGVTLVLKGWRTLIAHPDGRIAVNTTGNPSMAKGGSGDILTGIVSALLAQYANQKTGTLTPANVADAVEAAVFLHGLAGDFACLAQDEHTVLATDTVAHLWQAFRSRTTDANGLTWLTGLANTSTTQSSSKTR